MILELEKWKEILNLVENDNNSGDVLEQIKAELEKQDKDVYKKWEEKNFDINHLFDVSYNTHNIRYTLLHIAALYSSEKIILTLINKNADPWLKSDGYTTVKSTPVDIYTLSHPLGYGYLMKLKVAKDRAIISRYSTMLSGAIVGVSLFAADIITPKISYVIGAIGFMIVICHSVHYIYKASRSEPINKPGEVGRKNFLLAFGLLPTLPLLLLPPLPSMYRPLGIYLVGAIFLVAELAFIAERVTYEALKPSDKLDELNLNSAKQLTI